MKSAKKDSMWVVKFGTYSPVVVKGVFTSKYRANRYMSKQPDKQYLNVSEIKVNRKD